MKSPPARFYGSCLLCSVKNYIQTWVLALRTQTKLGGGCRKHAVAGWKLISKHKKWRKTIKDFFPFTHVSTSDMQFVRLIHTHTRVEKHLWLTLSFSSVRVKLCKGKMLSRMYCMNFKKLEEFEIDTKKPKASFFVLLYSWWRSALTY
jgi:hypothetical protein